MYVRCLDKVKSTIIDDKFDKVLENNKAIKKTNFEGINFCCVDLSKSFQINVQRIKNKK